MLMLVECHADTFSAAAYGDTCGHVSIVDGLSQGMPIIGIVTTGLAMSAVVDVFDVVCREIFLDMLLECISCVVAG